MKENPLARAFKAGRIVICDLTDPFLDSDLACTLFDILTSLYLRHDCKGKSIILDEAHKYLKVGEGEAGSMILCESLTSYIRLQRHLGLRMVLASQGIVRPP
jgi:hypothetical protein